MDAPPGVFPVVENVATEQMPADAPHMPILAGLVQMLVTHHEIVEALNLERKMIQTGGARLEAQKRVMVDEELAAVTAVERRDDVVLRALVDFVGRQEAQQLAIPAHLLRGIPGHEDDVR